MFKIRNKLERLLIIVILSSVLYVSLYSSLAYAADCGLALGLCSCNDTVKTSIVLNSSYPVTLQQCNGTGLIVGNPNITIDGGGFTILGNTTSRGIDNTGGHDNVTIINFARISNFTIGVDFSNVLNSTVFNNTILIYNNTEGSYSRGIKLTSSNSNNISFNNVTSVLPTHGWGMDLGSSLSNILANNDVRLNAAVTMNTGIWLEGSGVTGNNITSNNIYISSSTTNARGITHDSVGNNRYTLNNITVVASSSTGIYMNAANTNFITSNIINMTGTASYGLYILNSPNQTVSSNTVYTNGNTAYGMRFSTSNSTAVTSNTITTNDINAFGIRFSSSGFSNMTSNTITTTGNSSEGIHIDLSSANIRAMSNTIQTYGTSAYGIRLHEGVLRSTLNSNTITTNGVGANGVFVEDYSNLTAITGNLITTYNTSAFGVNLTSAYSNNITDGMINATNANDIVLASVGTNTNLINVTFNRSDIGFNSATDTSSISAYTYLDVFVKDNDSGAYFSDANVTIFNSSNLVVFSGLTGFGSTGIQNLLVFRQNATTTTYSTPHIINTTYTNAIRYPNSTTINFSAVTLPVLTVSLLSDTTAPTISILNVSSTTGATSILNITAVTDENSTCKFDYNDSAYSSMANTMTASATGLVHYGALTYIQDSGGIIYARCKDPSTNAMTSSNYTLYNVNVNANLTKFTYDLRNTASLSSEGDWIAIRNMYSGAYDSNNNAYFLGSSTAGPVDGTETKFGYYNLSSNITVNKKNKVASVFTQAVLSQGYDEVNRIVYVGGSNGVFGYYNLSSDTITVLTNTNTSSNRITSDVAALFYVARNNLVYIGGVSDVNAPFSVYNITSNKTTSLRSALPTTRIYDISYSPQDNMLYMVHASGGFESYNLTRNETADLSNTDVGNWIDSNFLYATAYNYYNNMVYLGGQDGRFGFYNLTVNVTYDLNNSDANDWIRRQDIKSLGSFKDIVYIAAGSSFGMYNVTTNVSVLLNSTFPNNSKWNAANNINKLVMNNFTGDVLIIKDGGVFGLYNFTSNRTVDLSTTDIGQWLADYTVYAVEYASPERIYVGGASGKFGYYNKTSNITTDLSDRDTNDFMSTYQINDLAYDPVNDIVYIVGGNGFFLSNPIFAAYNATSNIIYDLRYTNTSSTNLANLGLNAVEYDPVRKVVFIGGSTVSYGFLNSVAYLGFYNHTLNKTFDLYTVAEHNFTKDVAAKTLKYNPSDDLIYVGLTYNDGGFGAYNYSANITYNLSKKGIGSFMNATSTMTIGSLAVDSEGIVYLGGDGSYGFGKYNRTRDTIEDLTTTDANSWLRNIGALAFYGLEFGNNSNSVFIGEYAGNFGYYNVTSNVTSNLTETDIGNWMGMIGTSIYGLSYDHLNDYVYLVGDSGQFGVYGSMQTATVAPVISSVSSSPSSTSSTITWTTDESSNSSVNYGTTQAVTSNTGSSTSTTSHSISLSSLSASTTYYYFVKSCDTTGNCNISSLTSFTTTAADGGNNNNPGGGGGGDTTVIPPVVVVPPSQPPVVVVPPSQPPVVVVPPSQPPVVVVPPSQPPVVVVPPPITPPVTPPTVVEKVAETITETITDATENVVETVKDVLSTIANIITGVASSSDNKAIITKSLRESEGMSLTVAGESHTLAVGKINYISQTALNSVELTLQSEPITLKLFTGETVKVDLNKDKKDDLSITVVEITSDSVVLKLIDLITGKISITDAFNLFEKIKAVDISKATACINSPKTESAGDAEKEGKEEKTQQDVKTEKAALGKEEKLNLKKDQSIAVEPFTVNCRQGSTVDLQLIVPVNYVDLEALRCKQGRCSPVLVKSLNQLECGNIIHDKTRTEQPLKQKIETLNLSKVELKLDLPARSLKTGGNKITVLNKNVPKDLSIALDVFKEEIKQPENENLKIVSVPLTITTSGITKANLAALQEKLSVQIEVPLISDPEVDPNTVLLYAKIDDSWRLLESSQDKKTNKEKNEEISKVKATIADLSELIDEDGEAVIALVGIICRNCERTSFENIYLPPEGSVAAVIMVHGLGSSPATFNDIINDIRFTKQPWQAWTFAYPSSKSSIENGKEFADNLQKNEKYFENVYIIGHSLGGIVAQRALSYAAEENKKDATKYTFIKKVKKAIIVGSPNDKVAGNEAFKLLFKYLVNVRTGSGLFDVNSAAVMELTEQKNIPKVSGIDYFVIAGTKPYEIKTALFTLKTDEIFGLKETNDGIVTTTSAQRIGGEYINDRCKNYWEIPETHTALIDNPQSRIIIEKLIAREIQKDIKDKTIISNNQYIGLKIPDCSADDKYVIVGKSVKSEKIEDKTGCSCGNGYCGAGEDEISCPTDCARFFREENLCKPAIAATALFGLIALAIISLVIYYAVQQETLQRRLRKALFWLEILFILLFAFNLLTCGIKAGIFLIEVFAIIVLFVYMYRHKKALGLMLDNIVSEEKTESIVDQAVLPTDNLTEQEQKNQLELFAKQQATLARQQKETEKEQARQQAIAAKEQEALVRQQEMQAKQQELLAKQQKHQSIEEQRQQLIQKKLYFNKQQKAFAFIQKQKYMSEVQQKAIEKYQKEHKAEQLETPATFAYKLLSMFATPFNKYDHQLDWIYNVLEKAYVAYNSGKKEEARKFYIRAAEIYKLLPFSKKMKVYYALRKLRDLVY